MSNKNTWISIVLVAIIFAGGGFYGGMKYQQSKTPVRVAGQGGFGGQGGFRRNAQPGSGFVNGQVINQDSASITVKNQSGGSQIVILAPSTTYRKAVDGTATDLAVGKMVTVTGSSNSDGSLTAQNVQIRDASSTPPGFAPQK